MVCIYCGHKTEVANSRPKSKDSIVWRRRHCLFCSAIFTTYEIPDLDKSLRVKSSSSLLRPFLRDRIFIDVYTSISHRKDPLEDATQLTDTIISRLIAQKSSIIQTSAIKHMTSQVLSNFDSAGNTYYIAHFFDTH